MGAYANEWHGAPIVAAHLTNSEAETGGQGEESNKEWRRRPRVPFGLVAKTPVAALQSLAGAPDPPEPQHLALGVFVRATRLCP
jgi:hypothetical protein